MLQGSNEKYSLFVFNVLLEVLDIGFCNKDSLKINLALLIRKIFMET
jgi:hypothetical protein